jgi:PhnB protein
MQIQPYLFFKGNCEEALAFYKSALGGDYTINRFEGSPMAADLPDAWKSKIMHATFTSGDCTIMASDTPPQHQRPTGSDIALSIGMRDEAAADRIFAKLSDGGKIKNPFQKMFWGAKFGSFVDKFGIEWMINCEVN